MHLRIHTINQWLQILVLATIPVEPIAINNVLIILWAVSTLVNPNKERFQQYTLVFISPFILYFLVHAAGILYSPDPSWAAGLRYLENKSSSIAIPFLLLLSQPLDRRKSLNAFSGIVCILCLICLGGAIKTNVEYNQFHDLSTFYINPWFFTYYLYADSVDLHPTYFSIFILFAFIRTLGWRNEKPLSYSQGLLAFFLGINLLLLMSRLMVALAVTYFFCYVVFGLTIPRIKKLKYLVGGLVIVLIISLNPVVQLRINDIVETEDSTFSGMNLKFQMWRSLYDDIISENVLFGIGSINQDEYIRNVYKEHGIMVAYEANYNSHNQYIESLVHHGVVGLMAVIFLYGFYLVYGIKNGLHLLITVLVIYLFSSLTESVLMRHKGIVFFSFIVPFLAFNLNTSTNVSPRLKEMG